MDNAEHMEVEADTSAGHGEAPTIDTQQARKHLRALGIDPAHDSACFRVIRARGGTSKLDGTYEELAERLQRENRKGAGIFIVVNAGGHRDRDIHTVRAVFADLDGAPLEPVRACSLRPHVVVETSPRRYAVYWRVASDFPVDEFAEVQRAIAHRFAGDSSVTNPSRCMRLAGYLHQKSEPVMSREVVLDG